MVLAISAILCAALFLILSRTKLVDKAAQAPGLMILGGAAVALIYRVTGGPFLPSEWAAAGADALLAALAFAAATQFRISRLAAVCPAAFRLTLGGAPLFLILCALTAFILAPELNLAAALLVAAALTLNGAAFDRRAVTLAPAPATIKAAVRLESAAILALGIPVAFMLEAFAAAAPQGMPSVTPIYEAARGLLLGFGLGGALGLASAYAGNKLKRLEKAGFNKTTLAVVAAFAAFVFSPIIGAHAVIAAAAAGLLWGSKRPNAQLLVCGCADCLNSAPPRLLISPLAPCWPLVCYRPIYWLSFSPSPPSPLCAQDHGWSHCAKHHCLRKAKLSSLGSAARLAPLPPSF